MRMNNRGFGLRQEIVIGIIMFIILLFVTVQIRRFYMDLEKETSNKTKVQETIPEEPIKPRDDTDYSYYYKLENRIKDATYIYIQEKNISLQSGPIMITSDTLIENHYLEPLFDENHTNECTANSTAYQEDISVFVDVYLNCNVYKTDSN